MVATRKLHQRGLPPVLRAKPQQRFQLSTFECSESDPWKMLWKNVETPMKPWGLVDDWVVWEMMIRGFKLLSLDKYWISYAQIAILFTKIQHQHLTTSSTWYNDAEATPYYKLYNWIFESSWAPWMKLVRTARIESRFVSPKKDGKDRPIENM